MHGDQQHRSHFGSRYHTRADGGRCGSAGLFPALVSLFNSQAYGNQSMLNLQHALFCNDVSAHTHIYTHIILYKASIWILNVLFLITPLRNILLFTAPPKIIVHCAHYIESPYELCCILAHELLCVSRTFLKAPPQRMMLYFLLCLYTPLYSMHFVQTRHKNDCASHKNRPALLLCTLVPILFFAIYKQIKKVFFRQRPYRVECTGSLPNSEVKRRRARLVLGWGTAREDLRVLLAFCNISFHRCHDCVIAASLRGCCDPTAKIINKALPQRAHSDWK